MSEKSQVISDSLARINDWVKVADTKAAAISAILAIYVATLTALLTTYTDLVNKIINTNRAISWLLIPSFAIAAGVYLIIRTLFLVLLTLKARTLNTAKNPFFFGHISEYKEKDYIKVVQKLDSKEIDNYLLKQVHANSTIASIKYRYVNSAIYNIVAATLFLIVAILSIALESKFINY